MINLVRAKSFCSEDISLIENYERAINDTTQTWICHHRLGIDLNMSADNLINKGLYFNRPANELMFLTLSEHARLHAISENLSVETIRKRKEALKNRSLSKETKSKISITLKDKYKNGLLINPMTSKNAEDYMTEEAIILKRKKQSESMIGKNSGKNSGMYGKPSPNRGKHKVWDNKELNKYHFE